ncbi:hypothetical protein AB3M83_02705 [Microbacterium sp. 179-B 1A2 NHS]|uniref:hypothetical protein n=1 Tax=Microbacterium sp. 179-B 1A2 NHS TaxID=3142383 RepID=UPI0039A34FA0
MSSPTPRRRPTPAVYRRRRLAVVLIALLIVGGIVALVIWQPWRMWTDAAGVPQPGASPSATGTTPPAPTPSGPPSPAASVAPSPSPTPTRSASGGDGDEEIEPCTTGDVTVTAVADKGAYGTGEMPQLSIRLVNDTEFPCLINVGTAAQTFEITSGSDTWWRSTDCQEDSSDQVVQLEGGQAVASAAPIVWDRTRSAVDTCKGKRQSALPGWYNLTVSIGGIESVEPAQFTLR